MSNTNNQISPQAPSSALDFQQKYSQTAKKNQRFRKSLRHSGNEIVKYDTAFENLKAYYFHTRSTNKITHSCFSTHYSNCNVFVS